MNGQTLEEVDKFKYLGSTSVKEIKIKLAHVHSGMTRFTIYCGKTKPSVFRKNANDDAWHIICSRSVLVLEPDLRNFCSQPSSVTSCHAEDHTTGLRGRKGVGEADCENCGWTHQGMAVGSVDVIVAPRCRGQASLGSSLSGGICGGYPNDAWSSRVLIYCFSAEDYNIQINCAKS